MSQRSLSAFFGTLVQPPPVRVKPSEVSHAILYFRLQDRLIRVKRQEAYNRAQKAASTLMHTMPMATLRDFVATATEMSTKDRLVRCLPHELLGMQSLVEARWSAQLPRTWCSLLAHAYFLSFTAPSPLHCPAPEAPKRTSKPPKKVPSSKPQTTGQACAQSACTAKGQGEEEAKV